MSFYRESSRNVASAATSGTGSAATFTTRKSAVFLIVVHLRTAGVIVVDVVVTSKAAAENSRSRLSAETLVAGRRKGERRERKKNIQNKNKSTGWWSSAGLEIYEHVTGWNCCNFHLIMASRQLSRILREAAPSKQSEIPQAAPQITRKSQLSTGVIIGISIGVAIGVLLAVCVLLCWRWKKKSIKMGSERRGLALPIRVNGVNSSVILSDSNLGGKESPSTAGNFANTLFSSWFGSSERFLASSGVTKFGYGEIKKATNNFTALLGQGAFGPVYKAILQPSGTTLAVKVLSSYSKQGEKEFQTEVMLLGRLHHRNLVNLVGYCAERGQRMLIYEFMGNGSLAGWLYDQTGDPLSWENRVRIAQDVSRGLEYLHEGAVPPVIHRDIKSANILLDGTMTARVADFGLSKEASTHSFVSGVKGTFGYVDPEYVSTNNFTEKSDVYSFGVLLFELITARNPQQGLMDYVHLAALGVEGKEGWGELLDVRLNGKCNLDDLGTMAALAYKCVRKLGKKRPKIRDVAQTLSKLGKRRGSNSGKHNLSDSPPRNLAPVIESDPAQVEVTAGEWSKPYPHSDGKSHIAAGEST
ncbi:hypothetical protein R1flu_007265 [Riccia fluitans]|uniref:non-specific serine/threonine protein kinase n=1 Tax=Riccia fluitans TaxID=41844 RepID=A0ABD1YYF3_9MARC